MEHEGGLGNERTRGQWCVQPYCRARESASFSTGPASMGGNGVGMGWEGSNSFFGTFLLLVDLVLGIVPGFTLSLCSFLMSNRKVTGQEPVSLPSS